MLGGAFASKKRVQPNNNLNRMISNISFGPQSQFNHSAHGIRCCGSFVTQRIWWAFFKGRCSGESIFPQLGTKCTAGILGLHLKGRFKGLCLCVINYWVTSGNAIEIFFYQRGRRPYSGPTCIFQCNKYDDMIIVTKKWVTKKELESSSRRRVVKAAKGGQV